MKPLYLITLIVIALILLALCPLLLLWAIGVIFHTDPTYSFKEWLAAFSVMLLLGSTIRANT